MSQSMLGPDALTGLRIAVSVSESPDLARLGLAETHLRLALGEIARAVLAGGGTLAYGGHLKPSGYTPFLLHELRRGEVGADQLLVCLAWSVHRQTPLADLVAFDRELGPFGHVVCLDPDGREIDPRAGRGDDPEPVQDPGEVARGLTAMREYMLARTHARVLIGGRRTGFSGAGPGLVEEALLTLRAAKPVYLAGGFGGVTLDIVRALAPGDAEWLPPPANGVLTVTDPVLTGGWAALRNGLTEEENRRLAATHRPSDVAALVSLGMGRLPSTRNGAS